MSKFRRRQAIANYAYHRDNFESYHNLSWFIVSNYKQALGILGRSRDTACALHAVGLLDIENAAHWLDEEKAYLKSRQSVPEEDSTKSAYYLALGKLWECQNELRRARDTFRLESGLPSELNIDANNAEQLVLTERQMVNKQEMEAKLLLDVQDQRWKRDSEAWNSARELVKMAKYRKAADKLEGLTVAQIFELSKMNIAGTGYKMRQHIGDAMKKHSKPFSQP
ncbi:hypothetical protein F5050DRAFT_1715661 [Lentinula boryana]|uniref:Uncharacterized protein n=1 Tax=Lentinula boryana TaxID=40481 RepID=A0ABQ8PZU1_9AGAR|nr:hypothetical protein F5050DRAFT_1715661 [Lentinula boryana]